MNPPAKCEEYVRGIWSLECSYYQTRFVYPNLSVVSVHLQWIDWKSAERFLIEQQTRSSSQKFMDDCRIWKAILNSPSLRSFSEAVKARRKMVRASLAIERSRHLAIREVVSPSWSKRQRIMVFSLLAQTMNEIEYWTSENHILCRTVQYWYIFRFSISIVREPKLSWFLSVNPVCRWNFEGAIEYQLLKFENLISRRLSLTPICVPDFKSEDICIPGDGVASHNKRKRN